MAEGSNEKLFSDAVAALDGGRTDDAIDQFELLADRGFVHPDASYDRALSYIERAKSPNSKRGDLGRAAAALEETLLARPNDTEAEALLDRVRQEIVRRRARASETDVDVRPSLGRAVVELFDENTWAILSAVGSAALSIGLALRLFFGLSIASRLSGNIAATFGAFVLLFAGSMALLERRERLTEEPAVVIIDEAHLLDENGATISGPGGVVPEGAKVEVTERRGTLAHVEWGTLDGWLSLGQLRLVARP